MLISSVYKRIFSLLSFTSKQKERHNKNPWLADYAKLGLAWRPYVMRLCLPLQKTDAVSTDRYGFRVSYYCGVVFHYADYRETKNASVLLGNSTAFGVGASCDERSVTSQISTLTADPWFNLSGRSTNITQDVLTLLLFGAKRHKNIVLLSGVNDLLFSFYFKAAKSDLPAFWGSDKFEVLNEEALPHTENCSYSMPLEDLYLRAMTHIDRAMLLLSRYSLENCSRVLVALQPLLVWTGKPLHHSEHQIYSEWNTAPTGFRAMHMPNVVLPWKGRFGADMQKLSEKHGFDFIDLNAQASMQTEDHLFADPIHLTDTGQRVVAELIADRLKEANTIKISERRVY